MHRKLKIGFAFLTEFLINIEKVLKTILTFYFSCILQMVEIIEKASN